MKNTILIISLLIVSNLFSQENFKWEKADSIQKTKNEIYSLTKVFIAKNLKAEKNAIQIDSKESGTIILKGNIVSSTKYLLGTYTYYYIYTVKFKMENNKYQINIDNVYCNKATLVGGDGFAKETPKIKPFEPENTPESGILSNSGPSQKKLILMMSNVKNQLQNIVDNYSVFLIKTVKQKSDW